MTLSTLNPIAKCPTVPFLKQYNPYCVVDGQEPGLRKALAQDSPRLSEEGGSIYVLTEAIVALLIFRGLLRGQWISCVCVGGGNKKDSYTTAFFFRQRTCKCQHTNQIPLRDQLEILGEGVWRVWSGINSSELDLIFYFGRQHIIVIV